MGVWRRTLGAVNHHVLMVKLGILGGVAGDDHMGLVAIGNGCGGSAMNDALGRL